MDVQEEGYYDYRMNPTQWGFFRDAKPRRPEDLIEYDFDASVTEIAKKEGSVVVPVCAAIEADLATMDDADRKEFMESLGIEEPGLNRVIRAGYKLLGLQTFFTGGPKEVRAWTIPVGATAPKAAGKIHTDFEKGFIRAQTISYDDYIAYHGEQGAKEAGKMRAEGKDYIVKDGDVITFLFNV